MVTIGETRMWHDITSIARSLHRIAEAVEKAMTEEEQDPVEQVKATLTKVAWKSEVAKGNTELGYAEWLNWRRSD